MTNIAVIGGGAWGTALAQAAANAGCSVTLWALEAEVVESINTKHVNAPFLDGIELSTNITATQDFADVFKCDMILLVTPSQFLRSTLSNMIEAGLPTDLPLICCSKGVELKSLKLMSEVITELCSNDFAILSGPSFAHEVANNLPVSLNCASYNEHLLDYVEDALQSEALKIYPTTDIIGAQIAGAMKNVIAIACGLLQGANLGENAKAALIVGGLREVNILSTSLGGKPETLHELCALGDLLLTCSSSQSRNTSFGIRVASGENLENILNDRNTVTEGVASAKSIKALADKQNIRLPICNVINALVCNEISASEAIEKLIRRS